MVLTIKGKYTTAKLFNDNIEEACVNQIQGMVDSPAFTEPVRIMPDAHFGKGSCVGFTMPVGNKLVPATIGVDIGCGIYAYKTNMSKKMSEAINWQEVDDRIRAAIPLGFNSHKDGGLSDEFKALADKLGLEHNKVGASLGTLGGGNHFIEFAKSSNDGSMWLLIHTGSRNLGAKTCDYHQKKAIAKLKADRAFITKEVIMKAPESSREQVKQSWKSEDLFTLSDDQAFLVKEDKEEYLRDMYVAQKYAHLNKLTIRDNICNALGLEVLESIESVHNYIDPSDRVIRKGAIRALEGEKVVIPFNMRDGSILAKGKGNPDWNNSAPHGAGRVMSRTQAKKEIDLDTFKGQMTNVWSSSVGAETLDEAPDAYKPRAEIEDAIKDCVEVYDYLIPIYNLKDDTPRRKRK